MAEMYSLSTHKECLHMPYILICMYVQSEKNKVLEIDSSTVSIKNVNYIILPKNSMLLK